MLPEHFPGAPALLQMEAAGPAPLPARSPAATAIPNPQEPSDVPRSSVTAVCGVALDTPHCKPRTLTSGPAARASARPSLLHPNMARITASPGGTAFR